jgi:hypothetical protein
MNSSKNITKKILADRLVEKLGIKYKDETEIACSELKIDPEFLNKSEIDPNKTSPQYRYIQTEELRINQIISVAKEVKKMKPGNSY